MKKDSKSPKNSKKIPGIKKQREFELYGLFLALPREEREEIFGYHTDQGFCKQHKVSPWALVDWKSKPELWEIRDKHFSVFKKYTADIISAVRNNVLRKGDAQGGKLFLQFVENWSEKQKVEETRRILVLDDDDDELDESF